MGSPRAEQHVLQLPGGKCIGGVHADHPVDEMTEEGNWVAGESRRIAGIEIDTQQRSRDAGQISRNIFGGWEKSVYSHTPGLAWFS